MVTVVTREANGIPLTHDQVDNNFTGLAAAINDIGEDVLAEAVIAKDAAITAASAAQTSAANAASSANAASIDSGAAATSAESATDAALSAAASAASVSGPRGSSTVGFLQAGASAVPYNLEKKNRLRVDLEDWGTFVPGVDHWALVQKALNEMPSGASLELPPRVTILLSQGLVIPAYATLSLNRSTIQQMDAKNIGDLIFVGSSSPGVYIRNGFINVNARNQAYVGAKSDVGRGIFGYQSNGLRLFNVHIRDPYGSMVLAAASTNLEITRCNIDDRFGTGHYGFELNSCSDSEVFKCTGLGKVGVTGYGVYIHGPSSRVVAHHCTFTYWQMVAIGNDYISPGVPGAVSSLLFCAIDDNTLTGPSADTSMHFGEFGSVNRNKISNSGDVGISMDYSRNCDADGNVIDTPNASAMAFPGCIDCSGSDNILINPGNQWRIPVDNGQRCGIWVPTRPFDSAPIIAPSGNVFEGNVIRDRGTVKQMYNGIDIADVGGTNINFVGVNYIDGYINTALSIPKQTNIGENQVKFNPTLLNSWVNTGGVYPVLSIYKDNIGTCFIAGLIQSGTAASVLFNLPSKFRPVNQYPLVVGTPTGTARVDIFTNGDVVLVGTTTGYLNFNGISFSTR